MTFKLENVVPWGRSLSEYKKMFNLSDRDLELSILDCGGGPSSFNVEQYQAGNQVISCDPIYQFTGREISDRIQETYPIIIQGLKTNYRRFVWRDISSPEQLGGTRMLAMERFLADFSLGIQQGRYVTDSLPNLSFVNQQFEIAVCSHLLFTYSEQFSWDFHFHSILEMCRVAKDVRIFPLLENFTGTISKHIEPVINSLKEQGKRVRIEEVEYEFQINGNQMLHVDSENN